MRILGAILVVFLSAGSSGCWSFRKKAPSLPPLDPPVNTLPAPAPPVDLPPEATTPVQSEPPPQQPPPEVTVIKPELQPPPESEPAKPTAKPAVKKSAAAVTPPPAGAPTATPPAVSAPEATATPPQLAELIEGDRRLELQREIDQSLDRARSTLMAASQRALTRKQNETATRVRTFIKQAEEARSRDISTAHQLARRADLLAQDLSAALN